MRLWSLHPRHLDSVGLVACWRETLLAQKVLAGETKGYTAHPQLIRFRPAPPAAIGSYLHGLADEADARGYRFNRSLVRWERDDEIRIPVTDGQLDYEWSHLLAKLAVRDPDRLAAMELAAATPTPHPIFTAVPGDIEAWEVRTVGGPA